MCNEKNVWINFALVIIKQAIEDLEAAIRNKDDNRINEIKDFFESSYYAVMCNIDSREIMNMVYKKAKYTRQENSQWDVVNFFNGE